ncbi:MAG: Metal dependent phosphohydrolase [Candidatus Woesebacteria bacterium GW2011_GWA2_40_7b]|uniref:Metal dependent phosphohydrolase n=1 Tax=Candidatus Woesebacteria bacterium GW2011_GWA2_40_7b TaxID=1618563 RepID=A0A0G0T8X6_9BACT|nr:MAG: Metal dependent phosphohydrolase [Candidatus Woesebacteria bacterium GW2011_GWA2_40_7b]
MIQWAIFNMDKSHTKITKASLDAIKIEVPLEDNKILAEVVKRINSNDEIKTLWKIINVNAIDRLGMSDHGPTHFKIVANNGLKIARMLAKHKVVMSVADDFGLTNDHAEVIIFLACIMHDLGMSIHREDHEAFSLFLAKPLLEEVLHFLPDEERVVAISEVLHAIISHRAYGKPSTIEGGIIRIADALDMGKGRARISYKRGEINIYSVSDNAIVKLDILEGKERPVEVRIYMTNPAGIFQVDDLMKEKLKGSKLEKYISVSVYLLENGRDKLYKEYNL